MTCRCGYQFCYVCGADWSAIHYNNHTASGEGLVQNQVIVPQAQEACCDCACLDDCCGGLSCLIKIPLKIILLLLFFLLMAFIFFFKDLFIYLGIFILVIFAGMFGFSCEFLS